MSFLLQCQSKECRKMTDVVLDKATNKVHCGDCDEEIPNATIFIKNCLVGAKKFRVAKKSVQSYALECKACHKKMTPLLVKGELSCPECREIHQVTSHFKSMFIQNLKRP